MHHEKISSVLLPKCLPIISTQIVSYVLVHKIQWKMIEHFGEITNSSFNNSLFQLNQGTYTVLGYWFSGMVRVKLVIFWSFTIRDFGQSL